MTTRDLSNSGLEKKIIYFILNGMVVRYYRDVDNCTWY
jgi:hypothetical protein